MRKKRVVLVGVCAGVLIVALLVVLLRPTAGAEVSYQATFLPSLGGAPVIPHAINDRGQVVGTVEVAASQFRIVVCDKDAGVRDAGPCANRRLFELRINNAGQVAGTVFDANEIVHAFIQDPNGARRMLADPAGRKSVARALNNRGQVAGYYETAAGPRHGCLWDRTGRMTDLGTLGGLESLACGINDRGQVVGVSDVRGPVWQAFLWDPNTGMIALGPDVLKMATSCHINNKGLVAGGFGSMNDQSALSVWTSEGGLQRVATLGSVSVNVAGLNDAGQILVNTYRPGIQVLGRAFFRRSSACLCDPKGGYTPVEGLLADRKDVICFNGAGMNNHGHLVGVLFTRGGGWNAAVLEPIK